MTLVQRTSQVIFFVVILISLFFPFSLVTQTPTVLAATTGNGTLSWNANTESDLAGYDIFFGDKPGVYNHKNSPISVGKVKSYNFPPGMLTPGVSYYFAFKAKDLANNKSGLSNEITGKLPADTPLPPADNSFPTVNITTPSSGASVSGVVSIKASASDNIGVVGVRFLANDVQVGAEDTNAPYSTQWDTSSSASGTYKLKAIARDAAGNKTTSAIISVTVGGGGTPSSGSITVTNLLVQSGRAYAVVPNGLNNGGQPFIDRTFWKFSNVPTSLVGQTFIRTANRDKHLTNNPFLRFNIDQPASVYVGHDVTISKKPSWLTSFSKTGLVVKIEGATLEFYKKDFPAGQVSLGGNDGNNKIMYSVVVTSNGSSGPSPGPGPDTTPPTVSISAPGKGDAVSGVVSIKATAVDDVGVAGVRFFINNAQLGNEDTTAPFSINWDTAALLPNTYNLKAIARDGAGNTTTSTIIPVTVGGGGTPSSGSITVTNLLVQSGRAYAVVPNGLNNGGQSYIDRITWKFSNVPTSLVGQTFIRTANRDKHLTNNPFLRFNIDQPATVYVGHDVTISKKPSWLTSFSKTGLVVKIEGATLEFYKKDFPAGQVSLGGNDGKDNSMYTVIVTNK